MEIRKSGTELIAEERARQISQEGWTPEHDDFHWRGELARAAACYALPYRHRALQLRTISMNIVRGLAEPDRFVNKRVKVPVLWPWATEWWKPSSKDRRRELVIAGALIAAEIDRLQRLDAGGGK